MKNGECGKSCASYARIAAYLLEELYDKPEQVPEEELVAARDCRENVPKRQCGGVLLGVWEVMQACYQNTGHVECEGQREKLHTCT